MAKYDRMDNQSEPEKQLDSTKPRVGRSVFDNSHLHSGNAVIGALVPILNMEVLPNEDIDINLNALIQLRNPLVRPIYNGMRVYFHGYVNYLVDLWEGAKNFLDNGRSGKISLQRPNLIYKGTFGDNHYNACTPLSLLDYLGLPCEVYAKKIRNPIKDNEVKDLPPLRSFQCAVYNDSDVTNKYVYKISDGPDFFPADCCMAYQRNWRDFYAPKNLLQNNDRWFPANEDHFILSYACESAVCINYGNEALDNDSDREHSLIGLNAAYTSHDPATYTPEPNNPATSADYTIEVYSYYPNLSGLKFRQFKGDRFTTALPFPDLIRGDIPLLSDFADINASSDGLLQYKYGDRDWTDLTNERPNSFISGPGGSSNYAGALYLDQAHQDGLSVWSSIGFRVKPSSSSSTITMNDIRALETWTVFRERMARTNGDYNDMIEAQYGYNPHWRPREATYIGGFYTDFSFSSVVQTSQSTDNSSLGDKSGDGTAQGSGRIGHVHTRDFGWLQVYMSIVPDVMYTQGIQRQFSRRVQSDMYFPLFNNLAPQAILNKELYVSGDVSVDNDVFAYEDRYAEFKSKFNRVSGFMSLPHSLAEYDSSRIMARRFSSTPQLNSQFLTLIPENIDMEVFTVRDEPTFDFQAGFNITRVAPMPYTAIPGSLSSNLHA